ncbi:unnamed protein product [Boreogadus saida]
MDGRVDNLELTPSQHYLINCLITVALSSGKGYNLKQIPLENGILAVLAPVVKLNTTNQPISWHPSI